MSVGIYIPSDTYWMCVDGFIEHDVSVGEIYVVSDILIGLEYLGKYGNILSDILFEIG